MRALKIALFSLLLLPVFLYVVYLVGLNVVLNTSLGRPLLMGYPHVVLIRYQHAWSVWPGRVHVTFADITGQDNHAQFEVTADEGVISFYPAGISDKVVTGGRIRGHGFTVRVRIRTATQPTPEEMDRLPEIRDYPSPLQEPGPYIPPTIGVDLSDIDAKDVREVWVDDYHFVGSIDVKGGLYYSPQKSVEIYPAHLEIRDGRLFRGTVNYLPLLDSLTGIIEARVQRIDLRNADKNAIKKVDANVDLKAALANLRFVSSLYPSPDFKVVDGQGALTLSARVKQGKLLNGTELSFDCKRAQIDMSGYDIRTDLHVGLVADAARDQAKIDVDLSQLALGKVGDAHEYAKANLIRVRGHTKSLDLTAPMELAAHIDLPGVSARDLRFLNRYIPEGQRARIENGTAELEGQFDVDTEKKRGSGDVKIHASNLLVQDGSARMVGGLRVHVPIRQIDLDNYATDLNGSSLELEDMTIAYDNKVTEHWWFKLALPELEAHPNVKTELRSRFQMEMKNLQPVVGVIAESVPIPWIAKSLANQSNMKIDGHVVYGPTYMTMSDLKVAGGDIHVNGVFKATDLDKKKTRSYGVILFKWQAILIGLEIHDKAVKPILVQPQSWYDKHIEHL